MLLHHRPPLDQRVQSGLHRLQAAVQQAAGGVQQLVPGQKDVAVVLVVAQLIGHRRFHPAAAVGGQPQAHGDLVRGGEGHAPAVAGQQVGVLAHHLQRLAAVQPPQVHGQHRRQLVLGQKGHQPPQPHMLAESLGDLPGLFGGDALDGVQPLRLPLQDVQGLRPEPVHNALGGGGAHAFTDAGGEVAENLLFVLRQ